MPIDPWTEAWEEAEASAPPAILNYSTLEIQHPSFITSGSPVTAFCVRIVAGSNEIMNFPIEAEALFTPGEMAEFNPAPFYADRPEFAEGKTPEVPIIIENIAEYIRPVLLNASEYRSDLIVIYREYNSDQLDEPAFGPVEFKVRNVTLQGAAVRGIARLEDLHNRKFPRKVYTISEFPGLLGG